LIDIKLNKIDDNHQENFTTFNPKIAKPEVMGFARGFALS